MYVVFALTGIGDVKFACSHPAADSFVKVA